MKSSHGNERLEASHVAWPRTVSCDERHGAEMGLVVG